MQETFKRAELARCLGMKNGQISTAVKRNLLILGSDNLINITESANKIWIDNQVAGGRVFDINALYNKEKPITPIVTQKPRKTAAKSAKIEPTLMLSAADNKKANLAEQKVIAEIQKLENSDKLEKLKIAKLEGELLPVDAIEHTFIWCASNFTKTYEQNLDNLINVWNKQLDGKQEDFIEMKKEAMEYLATAGQELKENLLDGLKNEIKEYSEVRSRGERR